MRREEQVFAQRKILCLGVHVRLFFLPFYLKNWSYSAMTGYVAALEPRRVLCSMNLLFYHGRKNKTFTFSPPFFLALLFIPFVLREHFQSG